jgi:hypothetical protein
MRNDKQEKMAESVRLGLGELKEMRQRNDAFGHESTERRQVVDRRHRVSRKPSLDELDWWR